MMNLSHTNLSLRVVGDANFDSEVLHSKMAVLVAFQAPWSKPCRLMDPVLLEVAQACAGQAEVITVNADDNPNLSLFFGVQHIPALLFFKAGKMRGQLIGTASKEAVLDLISAGRRADRESLSTGEGGTR